MSEPLQEGSPAPDFTLPSTVGPLSLADLRQRGKVVLAFYVEDGTPTCARQLEGFRDEYALFEAAGATLVAISADPLERHQRYLEKVGGFPFPLASDTDLAVARAYDAVDTDGRRCRRSLYVIDPEGKILLRLPHFTPGDIEQMTALYRVLGVLEEG